MKITKHVVETLPPGTFAWQGRFGVKATDTGTKVYLIQYRIGGRQRRFTIGKHGAPWTVQSATKEATRLLALVGLGTDPMAAKLATRTAPLVKDLAERFLHEHVEAKRKARTVEQYAHLVAAYIAPTLGHRAINNVSQTDVATLHHRLRSKPTTANRTIAVLSKMMSLAERWGLRTTPNPCRGLERFQETKRRRHLSDLELSQLGAALATAEQDHIVSLFGVAAIRLIALSGCRRNEILKLRWDEVDLEAGELRLQDSRRDRKWSISRRLPSRSCARCPGSRTTRSSSSASAKARTWSISGTRGRRSAPRPSSTT